MEIITLKGGEVEVQGVPEVIRILPLGHVTSQKGEFDVDEESLRLMKAEIARHGVDVVVDYEHQTLDGVQAPAAGWVKDLSIQDGHIVAKVEWTDRAAAYLKNREYRYLSPVITVRKADNKATGLHSLALTNTPAIDHMDPIVNSSTYNNHEGGQNTMDPKELAKLLGLPEDATEEQITQALTAALAELKKLKEDGKEPPPGSEETVANKAVCELLGLKSGAATSDVTAKIMELKGGIVDGVNLREKVEKLEKAAAQRDADEAVTQALKAGKIAPAQKEWATSYALSNPRGFSDFVEKAPQVVPMDQIIPDGPDTPAGGIDEATRLVCKQLGINEEDVKKYGMKEEA